MLTVRSQPVTVSCMAATPLQTDLLWPDPESGPWLLHIYWRVQHGALVPVGLGMRGWLTDDERRATGKHNVLPGATDDVELPQLTGKLMRDLSMRTVLAEARQQLVDLLADQRDKGGWPEEWVTAFAAWRDQTQPARVAAESGRRGRDLGDAHYQEVADVYSAAVREGRPPTAAVAEHWTVEKGTAAKKVARARERGLLPPTSRGRVGRLTEEL